jgi:hypothetical protein
VNGRARAVGIGSFGLMTAGFAAIVLSRLPQWLGGQLVPDGDECIVALMAKHLLERGEVSLLFWGQSYGFAFFEAATAAAAFRLYGVSDAALKGAILFLWSIGWCFHVLAVDRLAGRRAAVIAAVALIAFPGWGIASMKAFGGPVTAFMFTGFVLWLAAHTPAPPATGPAPGRAARFIVLGACGGVIFLGNPMWLLPNLPVVAHLRAPGPTGQRQVGRDLAALACGFVGLLLAVLVATRHTRSSHWTPDILSGLAPGEALLNAPVNLVLTAGGAYWMDRILKSAWWAWPAGALWFIAWIAAALWVRAHRRTATPWLVTLLVAGSLPPLATLGLRTQPFQFRYLAPAMAPFVMTVAIVAAAALASSNRRVRALVATGLAILLLVSSAALQELRGVSTAGVDLSPGTTPSQAFAALFDRLRAAGVRHVYSTDPMLQWQIMWRSREQVVARYKFPSDRYPAYPAAVDRALRAGERVAIFGRADRAGKVADALRAAGQARDPEIIAGAFTLVVDPGIDVIRHLGFQLGGGAGGAPRD